MNTWLRCGTGLALAGALAVASAGETSTARKPMTLRYDPAFILSVVAMHMNVALRQDISLPVVLFESSTPLRRFQNAIEPQWTIRPRRIANSYVIARNEIYLSDDPAYYRRLGRSLDESLAHEFAHYIQAQYLRDNLASDSSEAHAVAIQIWFRETYIETEALPVRAWEIAGRETTRNAADR